MLWFDSKRLFIVLWFDFESVFTFYDLILKECKFWNIIEFMFTIFNNKINRGTMGTPLYNY